MIVEDNISFLTSSDIDEKLPPPRRLLYRQLLAKIGDPTLIYGQPTTKFLYATGGVLTVGSNWYKGINFDPTCDIENQRKSLDTVKWPAQDIFYCRVIDGNWVVSLDVWI